MDILIDTLRVQIALHLTQLAAGGARLRPSISILNQDSFSVRIDGDRAGVVGSRFAAKAEASSPRETLRFSVSDGALPPGVALNESSGAISGNPTVKGQCRRYCARRLLDGKRSPFRHRL